MGDPPGRRRPRPVPARSAGRLAGGWPPAPGRAGAGATDLETAGIAGRTADDGSDAGCQRAAPRRGAAQGVARLGRGGGGAAGPGQRLERTRRRRDLAGRPLYRQGRGTHPAAGGWQRGRAGRTECHRCRLRQPRATGAPARRQRDLPRRPPRGAGDTALRGGKRRRQHSRAGYSVPGQPQRRRQRPGRGARTPRRGGPGASAHGDRRAPRAG